MHKFVEFRQLVHGKDAAVHAWNQTKVQRILGRHADARCEFGWINLANNVSELRAGRKAFVKGRHSLRKKPRDFVSHPVPHGSCNPFAAQVRAQRQGGL